ncbi:uncharacterized protein LOC118647781 [Monomorium pharaonis]|uniref:uncharacterized protein LOC118647781 n=1 Tax=Monomorium pharaonis TaxID=307658 RepID=UPI001745F25A|nr:uncharacterized protein LOC118647781 [Monomorium pharaonis]
MEIDEDALLEVCDVINFPTSPISVPVRTERHSIDDHASNDRPTRYRPARDRSTRNRPTQDGSVRDRSTEDGSVRDHPAQGGSARDHPAQGGSARGPTSEHPINDRPSLRNSEIRPGVDRTGTNPIEDLQSPNVPQWRGRGRRSGVRRQQERFMKFLYQLSSAHYNWGKRRKETRV